DDHHLVLRRSPGVWSDEDETNHRRVPVEGVCGELAPLWSVVARDDSQYATASDLAVDPVAVLAVSQSTIHHRAFPAADSLSGCRPMRADVPETASSSSLLSADRL